MKIMWWIFDSLIVLHILTGCPILWLSSHGLYHLLEKKVYFLFGVLCFVLQNNYFTTFPFTLVYYHRHILARGNWTLTPLCLQLSVGMSVAMDMTASKIFWFNVYSPHVRMGTGRGFINSLMLSSAVGFSFVLS